jgi:hypothetical protein
MGLREWLPKVATMFAVVTEFERAIMLPAE